MGSLSLLQGIFPTQGSNPGLPHCRWILYQLSHQGSPGMLEWVACPFSSWSSWPRNQTRVSCIAGRFFTSWATREAQEYWSGWPIPSPADLPDPGIEPGSPALQADSLSTELWGKPKDPAQPNKYIYFLKKKLHPPIQGVRVQFLVGDLRWHVPWGQKEKQNIKQKQYCNKLNKDF